MTIRSKKSFVLPACLMSFRIRKKLLRSRRLRPEVIVKEFNHPVAVLMGANLANEVALGQSPALSASMQNREEQPSAVLRSPRVAV